LVYVEKGFSYFALLLWLSQPIYPVFLLAQQWVFGDHTEFMVLVLQLNNVYREPILGFASQLAGTLPIETKADSQVMGQNWVQVAIGGKSHLPAPNLTWVSVES